MQAGREVQPEGDEFRYLRVEQTDRCSSCTVEASVPVRSDEAGAELEGEAPCLLFVSSCGKTLDSLQRL